jgi:hypothetical protein
MMCVFATLIYFLQAHWDEPERALQALVGDVLVDEL